MYKSVCNPSAEGRLAVECSSERSNTETLECSSERSAGVERSPERSIEGDPASSAPRSAPIPNETLECSSERSAGVERS